MDHTWPAQRTRPIRYGECRLMDFRRIATPYDDKPARNGLAAASLAAAVVFLLWTGLNPGRSQSQVKAGAASP